MKNVQEMKDVDKVKHMMHKEERKEILYGIDKSTKDFLVFAKNQGAFEKGNYDVHDDNRAIKWGTHDPFGTIISQLKHDSTAKKKEFEEINIE